MSMSLVRVSTRSLRPLRLSAGRCVRFESTQTPKPLTPASKIPSSTYVEVTHPADPSNAPEVLKEIERSNRFILPVYARPPLILARGRGSYLWDTQGRKYLDFTAGIAVNALGHADPEFVQTMAKEAARLSHSSNAFYNQHATALAELLVTLTQREGGLGWAAGELPPLGISSDDAHFAPAGGAKVFFSNSGTEANEGALKISRKVGKDRWAKATEGRKWDDNDCDKFRVACFENAFHGRSFGSLSATSNPKYQKPFAPMVPGFDVGKVNDFDGLQALVTEETCAVIVEPIQGEGGIFVVDVDWLKALRERCDEVGAVLIFDEIQCGLYRSGTLWAHSSLPVECHPDIVTMAKPLANGYPIGAIMMRDHIAETMTPGSHGTTFGGSPLACALGHHVLSRLSARPFVGHIQEVGTYLRSRLERLPRFFPGLVSKEGIRGRGLILGIPFRDDKYPAELVKMARERGLLILTAGKNVVRLVPSLNIRTDEVDMAVDIIESCLGEMHQR